MMPTYSDLLLKWDNLNLLARDLGRPYNTVAAWKRRNNIPTQYWPAVVRSAARNGVRGVTIKTLLAAAQPLEVKRQATSASALRASG